MLMLKTCFIFIKNKIIENIIFNLYLLSFWETIQDIEKLKKLLRFQT